MANELRSIAKTAIRAIYFSPATSVLKGEYIETVNGTVEFLLNQWADAQHVILGTITGSKIGTATGQKLGFWNATPSAQPAATKDLATGLSDIGLRAAGNAMPGRKGVGATVTAAKNLATTDAELQFCSTGTAYTVTLPNAGLVGQTFTIKRTAGANNLTVAVASAGTIDGAATVVLTAINQYVEVAYSGVAGVWLVTAKG